MGKFMNKQELILIVLLILLFDFNGFCGTALDHIMYGKRRHTLIFLIAVVLILYDIFIFHVIVTNDPLPEVEFKPTDEKIVTCEQGINEQVKMHEESARQLKGLINECKVQKTDAANHLTETIVLNYIALVLVAMFIACVAIPGTEDTNRRSKRAILGIPVLIVAILLLAYANIYRYVKR